MWDFGSGQEIRSWMPNLESERGDEDIGVTSLLYIEVKERRCIVASGWNNKLRLLEVSEQLCCRPIGSISKIGAAGIFENRLVNLKYKDKSVAAAERDLSPQECRDLGSLRRSMLLDQRFLKAVLRYNNNNNQFLYGAFRTRRASQSTSNIITPGHWA